MRSTGPSDSLRGSRFRPRNWLRQAALNARSPRFILNRDRGHLLCTGVIGAVDGFDFNIAAGLLAAVAGTPSRPETGTCHSSLAPELFGTTLLRWVPTLTIRNRQTTPWSAFAG